MSEFGFMRSSLNVQTADGRNFTLLEELIFARRDGTKLRVPIGATTDGMSIPATIRAAIPPADEIARKGFLSGVLHDGGYRGSLEILTPHGNWMRLPLASCDEEFCDDLIKEALESQGINRLESVEVWLALRACGWRAFDSDRQVAGSQCAPPAGREKPAVASPQEVGA